MKVTRRNGLGAAAATAILGTGRRGRTQQPIVRVGVLTDLSGPFRDITGPNGVACVRQAATEFMAGNPGISVEVIAADHRNKPDVGVSILRSWFDRDDVDMVIDLANSAVALACNNVAAEKNKVCIVTAGGTSALTGPACTPNLVHWTYDSWNLAHSTSTALTRQGGKTWFFIVPNYAYGKAIVADASRFVELSGGQVLGSAVYPFPETTDFSSPLLQAQSSGAKVIAFGAGGTDFINLVKQSREFGLNQTATLVGMTGFITDILGMGPPVSEGLVMTENFYWDLNDQTRSWFTRIKPQLGVPAIPNSMQAGNYAGTLHFLKAVKELGVAQAKASGRETVAMMKQLPTDDDCFGQGSIREDGRKIHAAYLFQVKPSVEVRELGAVYRLLSTTPAAEAFRPMSEGGCKLVRA